MADPPSPRSDAPLRDAGAHRAAPLFAQREVAALESYQLIPRLLHDVQRADTRLELLGHPLDSPIVPFAAGHPPGNALYLTDGEALLEAGASGPARHEPRRALALLRPDKMGEMMPKVRALVALDVAGLALDLTSLADTPPFGGGAWRPRHREDLAELRAAAGRPLWLYGVCSAADAEVAAEAALEGVVVHGGAAAHLGGPAAIEMLPEVIDAVAGMIGVYAGGPLRGGIDVFRFLAVGAEAVVVESDRALANLEAELHYAMRLTGCASLADIGYEVIFAPLFNEF